MVGGFPGSFLYFYVETILSLQLSLSNVWFFLKKSKHVVHISANLITEMDSIIQNSATFLFKKKVFHPFGYGSL